MKFQVSHGFIQGETHTVCEDYATSMEVMGTDLSVPFNPLVIVSDGCSAVENSDVGARIAALTTKRILARMIAGEYVPEPEELAGEILTKMSGAAQELGVPLSCCAATVLAAFVLNGTGHVYCFGDGVWWKTIKGVQHYTVVDSTAEMPPYIIHGFRRTLNPLRARSVPGTDVETMEGQFYWSFPIEDIEEIGIATDGVTAVSHRDTAEVLNELTGERVPARLNYFDRHGTYDDIGLAVIRIEN